MRITNVKLNGTMLTLRVGAELRSVSEAVVLYDSSDDPKQNRVVCLKCNSRSCGHIKFIASLFQKNDPFDMAQFISEMCEDLNGYTLRVSFIQNMRLAFERASGGAMPTRKERRTKKKTSASRTKNKPQAKPRTRFTDLEL